MTTQEILSAAYAEVFGIDVKESGSYFGEKLDGDIEIDYAHFDGRLCKDYDMDTDHIEAVVEDGSEGTWIGVFLVRFDEATRGYLRDRVGTIKTLDEGRDAWRAMGALAGEFSWAVGPVARKIYKASSERARKQREALAAFVAGILMGGDVERAPLNYADAYTMLYNWSRDDVEIPDGLTTRAFMDEWNRQIAADAQQH